MTREHRHASPDAVQWSEGMLLSPQHLQQSDIYWNAQLRARMACLDPELHGLLELEIDARALQEGVLEVRRVVVLLPDGLLLDYPRSDERLALRLDLKPLLAADGQPRRIWLGAPRRGDDAARQDGFLQRYDSLPGDPVADENLGGNPLPVARLRPNPALLADEAQLGRYSACPLLEVRRDPDGHYRLAEYHPPALRLAAFAFLGDDALGRRLAQLSRRVWAKARELAGRSEDAEDEELLNQDGRRQLELARRLAAGLPWFDVTTGAPDCHPRAAYQALALLAGQAAGLGGDPLPPALEPYLHEDCLAQFRLALDYVERKLERINAELERLPFAPRGEAGFARHLPAAWGETAKVVLELKPRAGQSLQDLRDWLDNARIAGDDLMNALRLRRLPGAWSRPLTRAEVDELRLNPGAALFLAGNQPLDLEGVRADTLKAGRSLLIQGAPDLEPPAGILLYRWKHPPALPEGGPDFSADAEPD